MNRQEIDAAMETLRLAETEVKAALKRNLPEGTQVNFTIRHNQKYFSTGVISYVYNDGYVNIRHDQAKEYSRNSVRRIHYTNVSLPE